ncbi:g064 [Yersinia phage phiR1-37]|uniref:hypothetical protein n=1 Tax=Yersinia phage phiR1-37 TaxID=331278 RepID=UPI00022DBCEC|nr:hypothetical protein phiR1-37_gp064 [Yersinia phage phiR1-37]CCE26088.1 g064 [Yersinia phage phiR1-37]
MFVNISSTDKVKEPDSISECFIRPNGTGFSINMALAKLISKNYNNNNNNSNYSHIYFKINNSNYSHIYFKIDKDFENRLLKFTPTKDCVGNFRGTITTMSGYSSRISVPGRVMPVIHKDLDYVRLYVKETEVDEETQKLKSFIVGY